MLKSRLAAFTVIGLAGGAALLVLLPAAQMLRAPAVPEAAPATVPATLRMSARAAAPAAAADKPAPRRVYRFSIVPGGLASRDELLQAIAHDPVVAAHYAGFDADKARAVTVDKARAVYVSYRKGDQVYWTAKKLTLAPGETVLTDGVNEIRGRCGNRISDVPRFPVEAHGPSERDLDSSTLQPADGGLESVSYAPAAAQGYDGQSHQLVSFPYGAGLLTPGAGSPGSTGRFGTLDGNETPRFPYATRYPVTAATPVGPATPVDTAAPVGPAVPSAPGTDGLVPTTQPVLAASDPVVPVVSADVPATLPATDTTGANVADPGNLPAPVALDPSLWPPGLAAATPAPTPASAEAPEPGSLWLGGVGLAAMLLLRRRRST
ncbi:PEP-CTERM sorting domain-containing protein [Massilia forsythiae]|uniref:PEP-CTERM sorting domain-containing protein n=1 Tax=Massilia forsythiae TaxID=2728020 RepID=A0A7Z2ZUK6_9BURK|nr:PEP-CTERM sorting domain-containing protein [Massilia forsythiae]QJE02410.1 PEP-CTERM sorting domain-containing protein [Massilia forsythiae]